MEPGSRNARDRRRIGADLDAHDTGHGQGGRCRAHAERLHERFAAEVNAADALTQRGVAGAHVHFEWVTDWPVTLTFET